MSHSERPVAAANRLVGDLWCTEVLAWLPDLVSGTLAPQEVAEVQVHVGACSVCAQFGAEYQHAIAWLRGGAVAATDPDLDGFEAARAAANGASDAASGAGDGAGTATSVAASDAASGAGDRGGTATSGPASGAAPGEGAGAGTAASEAASGAGPGGAMAGTTTGDAACNDSGGDGAPSRTVVAHVVTSACVGHAAGSGEIQELDAATRVAQSLTAALRKVNGT